MEEYVKEKEPDPFSTFSCATVSLRKFYWSIVKTSSEQNAPFCSPLEGIMQRNIMSPAVGVGALVLALALLPAGARAAEGTGGPYLSGTLGYFMPRDASNTLGSTVTSNNAPEFRLGLGYDFSSVRVEGEVGYTKASADTLSDPQVGGGVARDASGSTTVWSFMFNGYFDPAVQGKIKPYLGAGLGAARVSVNNLTATGFTTVNDSDTVFAAQAMVGVGYALTPKVIGSIGYRYFWSKDLSMRDSAGTKFTSDGPRGHNIEIGVRYKF